MRYAYIEPSAWVKRYYRETGTELTNHLFDTLLRSRPPRLLCSRVGMTEVVSVLNRHRNAGRVAQSTFNTAYAHFEAETRTRLEVEAERGLTPFVGREHELQLLAHCFAQAQEGHGQVVFLVGEAGLGKSRLLLEIRRRLGADATWREGHAMSFAQSMAFHPLIDLLRRNFRIEEDDSEGAIIEKIAQGVLRLDVELQPILPYLRYLLAIDPGDAAVQTMNPQLRRAEIFDALRRLLLRAAEVRPQVVVFEDLHWMDQATEAFLTFIADSLPSSRVLCLFTYRPGYVHPFGDRTYHTRIALPTLSTADTVQMAQAMLATDHLPDELATLIIQKAEGNPFFVEEVVKSLQETGAIRRQGAAISWPGHSRDHRPRYHPGCAYGAYRPLSGASI